MPTVPAMVKADLDIHELEASIDFLGWGWLHRFLKIPWKFKSGDLEMEFGVWHMRKGKSFVTYAFAMNVIVSVVRLLVARKDFRRFEQSGPVGSWLMVCNGARLIWSIAL